MLTADLVRPRVRVRGDTIFTQPLPPESRAIERTATELIALFAAHVDHPRRDLDATLEAYEGVRLDYPIIRGLAKVLRDSATFAADPAIPPAALREMLFQQAAQRGPILSAAAPVGVDRADLIAEVSAHYALSPRAVEEALYADLLEEQILTKVGTPWTAPALIARYNLELARGLLYRASEMRLTVRGNYKDLFKFIKLFKLMHTIHPLAEGGYAITLDGPISPFVRATLRYGGQMARFLPALMLCPDWTMEADIHAPWTGQRRAAALSVGCIKRVGEPL